MISLDTESIEESHYETSFTFPRSQVEYLLEEMNKGNHRAVIAHLQAGGSLNDRMEDGSYRTLAYYCFQSLEPFQIREILTFLPEDAELPWDAVLWIEGDSEGEQIGRFVELLPDLEKFHYPFEVIYERALIYKNLVWVDFFLSRPIQSLDVNQRFKNDFHMTVHPYTEMKIFAGQIAMSIRSLEVFVETDLIAVRQERIRLNEQVEQILSKMENHPGIDLISVREEMDRLRQEGYYFIGDPAWERDLSFVIDAMTYEGLEKQVAQGFNLYESIGPFFMNLGSGFGDCSWIALLCFILGYEEYELVDLMVKYHPQL